MKNITQIVDSFLWPIQRWADVSKPFSEGYFFGGDFRGPEFSVSFGEHGNFRKHLMHYYKDTNSGWHLLKSRYCCCSEKFIDFNCLSSLPDGKTVKLLKLQ